MPSLGELGNILTYVRWDKELYLKWNSHLLIDVARWDRLLIRWDEMKVAF